MYVHLYRVLALAKMMRNEATTNEQLAFDTPINYISNFFY